MIARSIFIGAALLLGTTSAVTAEWNAKTEEIGFGEKAANAFAFGSNAGLSFGCESNKSDAYLRIITTEKVSTSIVGVSVEIELSIDGGAPSTFDATVSSSRAETILVNASLLPSEAKEVADLLSSAKRSVAFRASIGSSKKFFSTTVSSGGSRKAIQRVIEICAVEKEPEKVPPALSKSSKNNLVEKLPAQIPTEVVDGPQLARVWFESTTPNSRRTDVGRYLDQDGRPADGRTVAAVEDCAQKDFASKGGEITVKALIDGCDKRKK
jgi:hypothetical protein